MKKILAFFALLSISCFAHSEKADKNLEAVVSAHIAEIKHFYSQLDGVWEGELHSRELEGDYPDQAYQRKFRLIIDNQNVYILTDVEGEWREYAYDYKIERHATNAVIFAQASDDAWVESISMVATLQDIDQLKVLWSRAVNNFLVQPDAVDARGFFQDFAVLNRVKD
ncbi:hypothetical protein PVT68_08960 [Microbulbifer bruguierae]|uniref:Uncharacterized protein n=1 Tax=Microbulbifer bruguierae TaxID=3029061 RepID=A0ABY8NK14_9GAMM|nr:hypothetical protein [Microbulbifer bruguierae]WGL18412.1 hypothetical protein PVT68_08960 [Microbulbifer bruguierae]